MRTRITMFLLTLCFTFAAPGALAQLPGQVEALKEQYLKDRNRGLITLNERYLALYRKRLDAATKAKRLTETVVILKEMEALKMEIAELRSAKGGKTGKGRLSLKGKKARFGSNRPPHNPVEIEFGAGGRATFTGLNGQAVEWSYEEGKEPFVFYFWGPGLGLEQGWKLELDVSGKAGVVSKEMIGFTTEAVLMDADQE